MSKLIQRLDALAHLSPDDIQRQISGRGWMKAKYMTQQQMDDLRDVQVVVGADNGTPTKRYWVVAGSHGEWTMQSNYWARYIGVNSEWWFCRYDEWNGEPPCPS